MTDWIGASAAWRALVVAEAGAFAGVEEAVALAGGRVERAGWTDAAAAIAALPDGTVVAIEAEGVSPALLAERLPPLAAAAEARDLPVVASMAVADIDLVAASLFGPTVQLLCAPDTVDRMAALLVAARTTAPSANAHVRDTDRDRLRRLHEEVARIADVLARLGDRTGGDRTGGDAVDDRRNSYDAGPGVDMADPQAIRQAIRTRRLRDGFFPAGLFEDPAWDMLLDLFAAELEGTRVSVSSLCIAAAVAPTTALRWIAKMSEVGLLQRLPDPQDRRRAFMALTDRARGGMRGYLAAVSRAGLSIA